MRARSVVQVHPGPPFTFSRLPSVVPQIPTHNWAHTSLHHLRRHSQRPKIFPLRRPCFIAVVLRIQVERRLNLRVTQDALHSFGFDFRLVHQPVAKRVKQVVKSEPLTVLDTYSGFFCSRSQVVGDEYARAEWFPSLGPQRRKHKVGFFRVRHLTLPRAKMSGQDRMQRDVAVRHVSFRFSVISLRPTL
jgi:hypothetical protein